MENKTSMSTRVFFVNGKMEVHILFFLGVYKAMYLVIIDGKIDETCSYIIMNLPKQCGGQQVIQYFTREIVGLNKSDVYKLYKEGVADYWKNNVGDKMTMQNYHLNRALKYS